MSWKEPGVDMYELLSEDITRISCGRYVMSSQTGEGDYDIWTRHYPLACTCPDYAFHGYKVGYMCRHMFALSMSEQIALPPTTCSDATQDVVVSEVDTRQCVNCGSSDTGPHGTRNNKNYSVKRRKCKSCGKTYSTNIGFERLSYAPEVVVDVFNMYNSGESSHGILTTLDERDITISHQTVLNWLTRLGRQAYEYASTLPVTVSKAWRTDELFIKIKGSQNYLYCIIDDKTRFWLAHLISSNKGTDNVRPMFADALSMAGSNPAWLISDGAQNFAKASGREYPFAIHIRHIHLQGDFNNNKMERFNGRLRDREKTMRSFKRPDSGILPGMWVYYNFIRKHMGLGNRTPARMAKIVVRGISVCRTLVQNGAMAAYSATWPTRAT